MNQTTDIIAPQTAEQMVHAYEQACQLIEQGYKILAEAELMIDAAFGSADRSYSCFDVIQRNYYFDGRNPGGTIEESIKRARKVAWRRIIQKLEVHKIASNKRWDKIQKDLEDGNLPELTVPAVYDILESFMQNAHAIQEELVKEVFEILRPHSEKYKTNSQYEIGKRVILQWRVESKFGGGFRVSYYHDQEIRSIDKVFHMLDGQPLPDTYHTPLFLAIEQGQGGYGETDYFRVKCYQNRNLHIEFKRLDLLANLNAIAGGKTLRDQPRKNGKPVNVNGKQSSMFG